MCECILLCPTYVSDVYLLQIDDKDLDFGLESTLGFLQLRHLLYHNLDLLLVLSLFLDHPFPEDRSTLV